MFGIKQNAKICAVMLACTLMPCLAFATPQRVVKKDSKFHAVEDKSGQNYISATCNNLTANIMAQKGNDTSANIMAVLIVKKGMQKKASRLYDVAQSVLSPGHDISAMKVGCLTRDGGVGINIPHKEYAQFNLKIQVDATGHVFLGYDQIGLELKIP